MTNIKEMKELMHNIKMCHRQVSMCKNSNGTSALLTKFICFL